MSPKFSLGVALGFTVAAVWKSKPYRPALRVPQQPALVTTAIEARLLAIESQLDQADRAILQQSKAAAARAFGLAKASPVATLRNTFGLTERKVESLRHSLETFSASAHRAAANSREQLETWKNELPARIEEALKAPAHTDNLNEPDQLELPPLSAAEPDTAAAPINLGSGLAERLARQRQAIDDLARKAAAMQARMTRPTS